MQLFMSLLGIWIFEFLNYKIEDVQEVQSSIRYREVHYLVGLLDFFFSWVENYDNLDSRALFALPEASKVKKLPVIFIAFPYCEYVSRTIFTKQKSSECTTYLAFTVETFSSDIDVVIPKTKVI